MFIANPPLVQSLLLSRSNFMQELMTLIYLSIVKEVVHVFGSEH